MFLYFVTQVVVVKKFLKRAINLLHLLSFYFVISFLPRIFETPPFTLQRSRDNGWTILDYTPPINNFWSLHFGQKILQNSKYLNWIFRAKNQLKCVPQCLKITQIVILEFFNFGIFHQFLSNLTCLVTLFDRKFQFFKNSPNWTIFGIFNELLSTQNVNVARFARNVE